MRSRRILSLKEFTLIFLKYNSFQNVDLLIGYSPEPFSSYCWWQFSWLQNKCFFISLPVASFNSVAAWGLSDIVFYLDNSRDESWGVKDTVTEHTIQHSKYKSQFSLKSTLRSDLLYSKPEVHACLSFLGFWIKLCHSYQHRSKKKFSHASNASMDFKIGPLNIEMRNFFFAHVFSAWTSWENTDFSVWIVEWQVWLPDLSYIDFFIRLLKRKSIEKQSPNWHKF